MPCPVLLPATLGSATTCRFVAFLSCSTRATSLHYLLPVFRCTFWLTHHCTFAYTFAGFLLLHCHLRTAAFYAHHTFCFPSAGWVRVVLYRVYSSAHTAVPHCICSGFHARMHGPAACSLDLDFHPVLYCQRWSVLVYTCLLHTTWDPSCKHAALLHTATCRNRCLLHAHCHTCTLCLLPLHTTFWCHYHVSVLLYVYLLFFLHYAIPLLQVHCHSTPFGFLPFSVSIFTETYTPACLPSSTTTVPIVLCPTFFSVVPHCLPTITPATYHTIAFPTPTTTHTVTFSLPHILPLLNFLIPLPPGSLFGIYLIYLSSLSLFLYSGWKRTHLTCLFLYAHAPAHTYTHVCTMSPFLHIHCCLFVAFYTHFVSHFSFCTQAHMPHTPHYTFGTHSLSSKHHLQILFHIFPLSWRLLPFPSICLHPL